VQAYTVSFGIKCVLIIIFFIKWLSSRDVVDLDTTYRIWRKADWVREDVERVFRLNEETGHVVVKQAGVYLVYAQVSSTVSTQNTRV